MHKVIRSLNNQGQINKIFEQDFIEARTEERPFSFEDRKFMKKMTDGVQQSKDSHYELPLPFKEDSNSLIIHKVNYIPYITNFTNKRMTIYVHN